MADKNYSDLQGDLKPNKPSQKEVLMNLFNTHKNIAIPALISIFLVLILLIVGIMNMTKSSVKEIPVNDISPTEIPTPTEEISPTPENKKVVPTVIPTKKITPTVTNSPTSAPTNTPVPTTPPVTPTPVDTEPPHTNVFYPNASGGWQITYKKDGQICAVTMAPTDNRDSSNQIQTAFRYDSDEWSSFEAVRAYLCKSEMPNGPHVLRVKSKDTAGNIESEQTINFTVNIEGN